MQTKKGESQSADLANAIKEAGLARDISLCKKYSLATIKNAGICIKKKSKS
jgi:hypothetical protein